MREQGFAWPHGCRAAVSLSFDDGRPSQLDVGMPLLDRAGVRATFYVSIGALAGRTAAWQAAADRGHEIGNHTLTHPCSANFSFVDDDHVLESYTLAKMAHELLAANQRIDQLIGVRPRTFAYPCGQTQVGRGTGVRSYVPLVARHFEVGRRAFDEVPNDPSCCDLAVANGMDLDGLSWGRSRRLLDDTAHGGRWLILVGHDVATTAAAQTVRTDTLQRLCDWCLDPASGVWIDTVARIGAHVRERQGV